MQDFRPICPIHWVRIPPPPDKNGLTFVRPVFILCGEDVFFCNGLAGRISNAGWAY